jgi:hypothetical protein
MSYSIRFDDADGEGDAFSLATVSGLASVGRWVDTLPDDEFSALRELIRDRIGQGDRRAIPGPSGQPE